MQNNKKQINQTSHTGVFERERVFYVLLAATTLFFAALAATVTLLGPVLAPSHFSASNGTHKTLTLSHVSPEGPGSSRLRVDAPSRQSAVTKTPSQPVPAIASAAPEIPSRQTIVQDLSLPDERETARPSPVPTAEAGKLARSAVAANVEAKSAAKRELRAKLARLSLARSLAGLQADQNETGVRALSSVTATIEATENQTPAVPAPTVVASLPGPHVAAEETAVSESVEAVELEDGLSESVLAGPQKPGAILPPKPGIKPEPPKRSLPVVADRNENATPAVTPVLAYATPGEPELEKDGSFSGIGKLFSGRKGGLPGRGSGIAVYDISAATVHMPDGTKLEAHSGIGHRKDNPKYAYVKNLGPTPPNIYDLRMRERRFHGVEAIRMLPRDRAAMKGRDGMLAHTPLLRRSNGSHGCVAFKDYNKFLKAFKAGKVKKMIVVPSMDKLPTYMAALRRGTGA